MAPKPGQIFVERRQIISLSEPRSFQKSGDKEKFLNIFPELVQDVVNHPEHGDMKETNEWLKKALEYNCLNSQGKYIRGLTTVQAYRQLVKGASEENIQKSYKLGWFVEILKGALHIGTDLMEMDKIPSPRGLKKPAWHQIGNAGPSAFNDAVLLASSVYYLLKNNFEQDECYTPLLDLIHESAMKRTLGETLYKRTKMTGSQMNYLNMTKYETIVKYKTSYFSFYCPVAFAMKFAGITDPKIYKEAQRILFKIGLLYQMSQDCFEAFYSCENSLQFRHQVKSSACTWPIFKALELSTPAQKIKIRENYGTDCDQAEVNMRDMYLDLSLPKLFQNEAQNLKDEILFDIGEVNSAELPKCLFLDMLNHISESF